MQDLAIGVLRSISACFSAISSPTHTFIFSSCILSTMSYLLVPLKVFHHRLILLGTFYQPRKTYPPRSVSLIGSARGIMSWLVSLERAHRNTSKTASKSLWDPKLARNVLRQNITQEKSALFPEIKSVSHYSEALQSFEYRSFEFRTVFCILISR